MSDDYISEFKTSDALSMLLVEFLFCSSICMIAISIFFLKLKQARMELLEKKEKAKLELTRLRALAAVVKPPPSKAGPDPIETERSKNVLRSETPPNAMIGGAERPPAPASDADAVPDTYKLAVEHAFVVAVLAGMAFPTGKPPPSPLPLTLYSPSEVPLVEKDCNGNDIGPSKIVRQSSATISSDPAGASAGASAGSGDIQAMKPNKKNKKNKKKKGPGAKPAPSFDLAATLAKGAPGSHSSAPAPILPVGPPPKRPKSEMAQSDLPIPTPPRKNHH